jgi:hypothetical protein
MRIREIGVFFPLLLAAIFAGLSFWGSAKVASIGGLEPIPDVSYERLEAWRSGAEPMPSPRVMADRVEALFRLHDSYAEALAASGGPIFWLGMGFLLVAAFEVPNCILLRRLLRTAA